MSVDWSKAPEGATHFLQNNKHPGRDLWLEVIQGYQMRTWYRDPDGELAILSDFMKEGRTHDADMERLIPRPGLIDHRMGVIDEQRREITREMFRVAIIRHRSALQWNSEAPAIFGAMAEYLYDNGFRKRESDQ